MSKSARAESTQVELDLVESLVRSGSLQAAKNRLHKLAAGNIERPLRPQLANLMRRVGLHREALLALHKILFPIKGVSKPSVRESAEYAATLTSIGAAKEALRLLGGLDAASEPRVLLYRVLAHLSRWEYAEALPVALAYQKTLETGSYPDLVTKLNLIAILVFLQKRKEAREESLQVIEAAHKAGHSYIESSARELLAQVEIYSGNPAAARTQLDLSAALVQGTGANLSHLFVQKWMAVVALNEGSKDGLSLIDEARAEALRLGNWETVRDCDLHRATALKSETGFRRLYAGTPYRSYREKLSHAWDRIRKDNPNLSKASDIFADDFVLELGRSGKNGNKRPIVFNAITGANSNDPSSYLKFGSLLQRLLAALCSDTYRPARVGSLHADIFSDQYFNPISSPKVIHQLIFRLRNWLKENHVPLVIREQNSFFHIDSSQPLDLMIPSAALDDSEQSSLDPHLEHLLEDLKAAFRQTAFSANQASEIWKCSDREARRRFRELMPLGRLESFKRGKAFMYKFL